MIETTEHGEVRELRFNRPPANAFDPPMIELLTRLIRAAADDGRAALVISGSPGMFTGGLDVPSLMTLDRDGIFAFWKSFFDLLHATAASAIPVAAAITGHSPAAGAVLASFCDFRVMARGRYKIGLNEVQVGLPVPPVIQFGLKRLTGPRKGDAMLIAGQLVGPDEALDLGVVDKLAEAEHVVASAVGWAADLLALPRVAMLETRRLARRDLDANFEELDGSTYEMMTDVWFSKETQVTMTELVNRLASG